HTELLHRVLVHVDERKPEHGVVHCSTVDHERVHAPDVAPAESGLDVKAIIGGAGRTAARQQLGQADKAAIQNRKVRQFFGCYDSGDVCLRRLDHVGTAANFDHFAYDTQGQHDANVGCLADRHGDLLRIRLESC